MGMQPIMTVVNFKGHFIGGDGDGHMTMLMKEEEVATSLAPTSEVISQPLMQQETISIKSNYDSYYQGTFL